MGKRGAAPALDIAGRRVALGECELGLPKAGHGELDHATTDQGTIGRIASAWVWRRDPAQLAEARGREPQAQLMVADDAVGEQVEFLDGFSISPRAQ